MIRKIAITVFAAFFVALIPLTAAEWDKGTKVTFKEAVELPGFVLQPGTYTFRLANLPGERHVVGVYNAEENHFYGFVLAIPNARLKATSETVMRFGEQPRNKPQTLRAWFYPGDTWGHEFVYPKAKAAEIAAVAKAPVLAAPVTPTEQPEALAKEPVVAITPEKKEIEIAQVVQPPPPVELAQAAPPPAPRVPPAPEELPKTGSPLPLFGLAGLTVILLGVLLRRVAYAAK
jgi:LPXTG-motif cell wall-anchored protein